MLGGNSDSLVIKFLIFQYVGGVIHIYRDIYSVQALIPIKLKEKVTPKYVEYFLSMLLKILHFTA